MTLPTDALAKLRQHIRENQLKPGDRLLPERELAEALGLTRSQIRTAMRQLVLNGTVWRHVGKGTFLSPDPNKASSPAALVRSINPRELIDARLALEPRLARLATVSASEDDFEKMEACITAAKQARTFQEYHRWDQALHMAIAQAARNTLLLELYQAITQVDFDAGLARLKELVMPPERQREATDEHMKIVAAIRNRDIDLAEAIMRRHLETTQRRLNASTYQSSVLAANNAHAILGDE